MAYLFACEYEDFPESAANVFPTTLSRETNLSIRKSTAGATASIRGAATAPRLFFRYKKLLASLSIDGAKDVPTS